MICCFTVKSFLNMSLPTAGMVIGWVCIVFTLFRSVILIKADEIIEFTNIRGNNMPELNVILQGSSAGILIAVALSLLDFIASVLLIIGVNKRNHLFLVPWLINYGISLTIKFFVGILLIVFVTVDSYSNSAKPWIVVIILSILVFIGMVWNAIYSLFQSIRKANENTILDTEKLVGNPNSFSYELFKTSE